MMSSSVGLQAGISTLGAAPKAPVTLKSSALQGVDGAPAEGWAELPQPDRPAAATSARDAMSRTLRMVGERIRMVVSRV